MNFKHSNKVDSIVEDILVSSSNKNDQPPLKIGSYRCSMIPSCIRYQWFFYKVPKEFPSRTMKIFQAGKTVHKSVESSFNDFGDFDEVSNEIVLSKDFGEFIVTGTADLLVSSGSKKRIVELKSIKSIFVFDEETKKCKMIDPNPKHLEQLNLYLGLSGLKTGWLVYVQKNDLASKSFVTKFDKSLFDKSIERTSILHKVLVEGSVPPAEFKGSSDCRWCLYRSECRKLSKV